MLRGSYVGYFVNVLLKYINEDFIVAFKFNNKNL